MRHAFKEDHEYTTDMPFGEFIRKKRRILGMNQADFGDYINVCQHTVSVWELGVTSPPIEDARKIIKHLGAELMIINNTVGTPDCPMGWNPYQE